jgi:predicted ATPase
VLERSQLPPRNSFFLRAERVFNLATAIEQGGYLGPRGLYLLDEPEAALSVAGQLALIARTHELVEEHSQFVVATHSPILLGFAMAGSVAARAGGARPEDEAPAAPSATVYELGEWGVRRIEWAEAPQVELTRSFLEDPQRFLRHLLAE